MMNKVHSAISILLEKLAREYTVSMETMKKSTIIIQNGEIKDVRIPKR